MNPINSLDRLAEILRKRVGNESAVKGKTTDQQAARTSAPASRAAPEELRKRVAQSIAAIDSNDPARGTKATRIFVEQALTWQFGDHLLNDPGFSRLLDEVQHELEKDPGFHEALLAACNLPNP